MRGIQPQIPRPKLNGIQIIRIINNKLLFLWVVNRFGHQRSDIAPMRNLCLHV